jgi:hypothetical protein
LPPLLEADNIRSEICGGFFQGGFSQVKRTNILAALLVALSLISTGCGTSDYVQSVQVTSSFTNLAGADSTVQLTANEVYHSGRTVPVTNSVVWTATPFGQDANTGDALPTDGPLIAPINATGLMTAVDPDMCTWNNIANPPTGTPVWVYTGYYNVTATYNGMVSQPVAIGVGAETSASSEVGGCGPTPQP